MSIESIRAEISEVKAEILTLRVRLKELTAELEEALANALKTYPSGTPLEAIEWERWEDTPETRARFNDLWWVYAWAGSKPDDPNYPPWKHVYHADLGELMRVGGTGWDAENHQGGIAGRSDHELICEDRLVDCAAPQYVAIVQEGDDKRETDPEDQVRLLKDYVARMKRGEAGLRFPLSTWETTAEGRQRKALFIAEYGGEPEVLNPKRPIIPVDA